jgi:hypothetical protein
MIQTPRVRTGTGWAKFMIVLCALGALGNGHGDPNTFWPIQVPLNIIMCLLAAIGYDQINSLRRECLEAKRKAGMSDAERSEYEAKEIAKDAAINRFLVGLSLILVVLLAVVFYIFH